MCLSRVGTRSISGLSRALSTNGATALTSCTSSSLDGRHVGEQQPPGVAIAQIDLLQILIEPAGGEEVRARDQLLGQQRHLRQRRGEELPPVLPILPVQPIPPIPPTRRRVRAAAHVCRLLAERRSLRRHHVRVEVRRPSHRLARVVDDEVETIAGGDQVAAERFDARRVPQIEPEDLEAIAPVAEVRLLRVAGRRVRESAW